MHWGVKLLPARFAEDEGGAVAILFAFSVIVLLLAAGVAIDFGRMHHLATAASARRNRSIETGANY